VPRRPQVVVVHTYLTNNFFSFGEILEVFTSDVNAPFVTRTPPRKRARRGPRIDKAVASVAGPVVGGTARLTNIAWSVSAADIAREDGNASVIAAGTGLGQASTGWTIHQGISRQRTDVGAGRDNSRQGDFDAGGGASGGRSLCPGAG